MARGDITINILDQLKETTRTVGDLLRVLLSSPYGTSRRQFERKMKRYETERSMREIQTLEQRRYYVMIHQLKREGFIQEDARYFSITPKGIARLQVLRRIRPRLPIVRYAKEHSETWVIVSFDVPEKHRAKRRWLRESLRQLGLQMIHKSVWVGKIKFPMAFLQDLRRLDLVESIEIFEVTKHGTLKHLV